MIKLKPFGKNLRGLKKILKLKNIKIIDSFNVDVTDNFKKIMLGFDFYIKKSKDGIELTDRLGETYYIKTEEEIEVKI